jgi:[ribosomal protein S5]-alanine N-acetyltransferase
MAQILRLRRSEMDDLDGLYALATIPLVYCYLFDGEPPSREYIARRLGQRVSDPRAGCFGLWFLQDGPQRYAGRVELWPHETPRTAEITWLLHPDLWGHGLASRMAWSAIEVAFASGQADAVIAGADSPNVASLALMRRLGMRFHRNVTYPLGSGVEYIKYILHRGTHGPIPRPELILADDVVSYETSKLVSDEGCD